MESQKMQRSRIGLLLVTVCAVLLVAGCGGHHRHLVVGGVEDSAKWADPGGNMALARRAGYQVIVLSSVWTQPHRAPTADEVYRLRTAVHVAQHAGIEPIVAVYSFGSQTPVTPSARAEFTAYAAAILRSIPTLRYISLGNEPNSKLFWMPQFGPAGSDVAATAYLELLETAYPAMKKASPDVTVIGGSLAARGNDRPQGHRQTHSPTRFIEDLGAAFRASRLSQLPLDLFSIHPYPANSSIPPTVADPSSTAIGIADYPKLVWLLTAAFGNPPPIVYGEYGIQTQIPRSRCPPCERSSPRFSRRSCSLRNRRI